MATHYAEEIKFNQTINQQMAESTLIQQATIPSLHNKP